MSCINGNQMQESIPVRQKDIHNMGINLRNMVYRCGLFGGVGQLYLAKILIRLSTSQPILAY